jgi:hypothetical protein
MAMHKPNDPLVRNGKSPYEIAEDLNAEAIKPNQGARFWHAGTLYLMVRNQLYKGEFYANQRKFEKR